MGFNPGASGVGGASDVALNNVASADSLLYDTSVSKWRNQRVATAGRGGMETVSVQTASTAATTLNLANGNVFEVTLSSSTTFTFSGAINGKACSFSLYLKQDATGGRAVTWPSGSSTVKWSGGAPTLTTTANAIDVVVFETLNGGTTWYGALVGSNFV